MISILTIFLQLSLDGLKQASQQTVLDGVLVSIIFISFGIIWFLFNQYRKKIRESKELQDEQINLLKEHIEKLEDIRKEIDEKAEERNTKWLLSEKEMLNVLNGVNGVLKLSDRMSESGNKQINEKLNEIKLVLDHLNIKNQ